MIRCSFGELWSVIQNLTLNSEFGTKDRGQQKTHISSERSMIWYNGRAQVLRTKLNKALAGNLHVTLKHGYPILHEVLPTLWTTLDNILRIKLMNHQTCDNADEETINDML